MFSSLKPYTLWFHVTGVYTLYVVVHFVTPYVYVRLCTPWTLMGFLASPLMAPAPHCRALRWTFLHTASNIDTMWLVLGTWCVAATAAPWLLHGKSVTTEPGSAADVTSAGGQT